MNLESIGTIGIAISVIAANAFVIGYLFLAPWYRSLIGISLLASTSWIAGIAWLASLRTIWDVNTEGSLFLGLRAALWVGLPVISVLTLWALLIRGQVRSHKRQVKEERRRERDEQRGQGGLRGDRS